MNATPNGSPDESATQRFDGTPDAPAVAATSPSGFEFLAEIGRGGMGVVFRAHDLSLDRDVAVKVLQDHYPGHSRTAAKFLEEARISAQLQHPGIPAIYAAGLFPDGRPWLAMKLIKGNTLAKEFAVADRGRLIGIFELICQAIGYAHSRRVIHRDLKPSNVMVGAFGEVQVMDWGLAKVLNRATEPADPAAAADPTRREDRTRIHVDRDSNSGSDTQYGSFMGTPAFMPPEQAIGAIDQIDERSDVFGLGAILCTVLTGQPPFVAADSEAARQLAARGRIEGAWERLDRSGAEPELVALAKRCLAVERDHRPANGTVVAESIAAFRADAEARARQAEIDRTAADVRASEHRKRRRIAMVGATLLAGAAMVVAAASVIAVRQHANRRESEARQVAEGLGQLRGLTGEARRYRADPERAAPSWREVKLLANRLEEALPADPADAGAAAAARDELAAARAEVFDAERDLVMVRAIESARDHVMRIDEADFTARQRVQDIVFNVEAAKDFAAAFQAYGIDLAVRDTDDAVRRLRERPIVERLALAIDDWAFLKPDDAGGRLNAIAGKIDPDPDRNRIRSLLTMDRDGTAHRAEFRKLAADATLLDRLPPRTLILLAFALRERNLIEDGVAVIERAAERYPGDFWINDIAGLFQQVKSKPDAQAACRYFGAAIALRPDLSVGYSNLANQLIMNGESTEAEKILRKVMAMDPSNTYMISIVAESNIMAGKMIEARKGIEVGLRLVPDSLVLRNQYAGIRMLDSDLPGARALAEKILEKNSRFYPVHITLLYVRWMEYQRSNRIGDLATLVEAMDRILREFPDIALVLQACGDIASNINLHDRALAHLRRATELIPGNAGVWSSYSRAQIAAGNFEAGESAARRAILLAPGNVITLCDIAMYQLDRGNSAAALSNAVKAAEISPESITAQRTLYLCQARSLLASEALATAERLCEIGPKFPDSWIALSAAAERLRPDRALVACEQALALQPDNLDVAIRFAILLRLHRRDFNRAESLLRDQLKLLPEARHFERARVVANLALVDRDRGRYDASIAQFLEAKAIGRNDLNLSWINGDLLIAYKLAGRDGDVVKNVIETVRTAERQYFKPQRTTPAYAGFLAQGCLHLLDAGAYREAEVLARECLEIREVVDEPRWLYFNAKALVGRALVGRKDYVAAEPYLKAGFTGLILRRDSIPADSMNRLFEAGNDLAKLFDAANRPMQGTAIRALLPKERTPPPRERLP